MNERLPRLLAWFDRAREADLFDIPPIVVTRERAREARRYLQEHSGFDFEAFEKNVGVEQLLQEPLGETPECLSAEEIAGVVRSHMLESPAALNVQMVARVVSHVEHCEMCFDNIAVYQEMERLSLARAFTKGVENLPVALWIDPIGRVEVSGGTKPMLGLSVTMHRHHQAMVEPLSAMKVRVSFPFRTSEVTLHRAEGGVQEDWSNLRERLAEWTRFTKWTRSIKEPSEELIRSYYRTNRLIGPKQAKNMTCGFVSVSQEIGGEEVYSTQVVRLEKS
jgi:hypothetical protein